MSHPTSPHEPLATAPRRGPPLALLVALALPLATLAAGFATLQQVGAGRLDAAAEPVRRTAQVQQDADPTGRTADDGAAALGLRARLVLQASGRTALTLETTSPALDPVAADAPLVLHLQHPLDARADQRIELHRHPEGWRGAPFNTAVGWRMALAPPDRRWRLVARWPRHAGAVTLLPAYPRDDDHGRR